MVKPGGLLYVSFIAMFANIVYFMQHKMEEFCQEQADIEAYKKCQLEEVIELLGAADVYWKKRAVKRRKRYIFYGFYPDYR